MGLNYHGNFPSILPMFLLIFSCFLGYITASDTIRVNESVRDPQTLVSTGEKFKLGFFSPGNSSYRYVGIMFNLPVMTVVWVANRDKPLYDERGALEISGDGNLVVKNGLKEVVWSTNISSHVPNTTAQLLDTGNLVLQDNSNSRIIWESFQHASDTLLQRMKMGTNLYTNDKNVLTSWRSPSDPAIGCFTATIVPLEIPQEFVLKDGYPYWRSGPWDGQMFIGSPDNKSVHRHVLDLINDNPGTSYITFAYVDPSVVLFTVLNASGILQGKVWSHGKGDWVVTWSSMVNECDVYGKCGPFGSCNVKDKPICTCFPGFEPKNKNEWNAANWSSGCIRRTPLQCDKNASVDQMGKEDGFLKLSTVKVPDHVKLVSTLEEDCMSRCLNNCSCIAYAYHNGIGCMHWDQSLNDVQKFSSGGADLYIRLANSELGNKKDRKSIIVTTVVLGFIAITLCVYFLRKLLLKYRGRRQRNELILSKPEETDAGSLDEGMLKHNVHGVNPGELPLFKFQMLSDATNKFDSINKLGQGGFGPVYKGKLPNGQEIAVKRLAISSNQGIEEFMNEVEVISKLQHRNLVRLLGCCVESEETMLVYEYMPNGSLDAYLFDSHKQEFLDWKRRIIIIEGICWGLHYLHRDSRLRIIHRDLKASNILLDEELNPKISDFGVARIFGGNENQANTSRVVGTFGYMPPEYALHGIFSEKSDVFSFGVLLLEIVSGKKIFNFCDEEEQLFLIAYAWKLWNEEKIANLMDPVIYDPQLEADVVRYVNVGLLCVQEIAADRPNIPTVLSMLNCEIVELPRPKKPAFVVIRRCLETACSSNNPTKCSINDVSVTVLEGR